MQKAARHSTAWRAIGAFAANLAQGDAHEYGEFRHVVASSASLLLWLLLHILPVRVLVLARWKLGQHDRFGSSAGCGPSGLPRSMAHRDGGAGGGQEQVLGYSSCDCLNNTGVLLVGLLYDVMRSAGKSVASAWLRTYSHHDCGIRLQLLLLHADGWHTCLLPCCFRGRTKALPPGPIVPLQHVTHAAGNPHVFLEVEAGLESRKQSLWPLMY